MTAGFISQTESNEQSQSADIVESSLDCPKSMVNDPYPGSCGDYKDADNNGICDHSE